MLPQLPLQWFDKIWPSVHSASPARPALSHRHVAASSRRAAHSCSPLTCPPRGIHQHYPRHQRGAKGAMRKRPQRAARRWFCRRHNCCQLTRQWKCSEPMTGELARASGTAVSLVTRPPCQSSTTRPIKELCHAQHSGPRGRPRDQRTPATSRRSMVMSQRART